MVDQLIEKEELGMPSPALDARPETDVYTAMMVDAYNYISTGCGEHGAMPVSEIESYYNMFNEYMVEDKQDFIYLMHVMHQPMLADLKDKLEQQAKR